MEADLGGGPHNARRAANHARGQAEAQIALGGTTVCQPLIRIMRPISMPAAMLPPSPVKKTPAPPVICAALVLNVSKSS
jgi:hypothetical protein